MMIDETGFEPSITMHLRASLALSMCDLAKIFLTSKFSYFLFFQPHRTKTWT